MAVFQSLHETMLFRIIVSTLQILCGAHSTGTAPFGKTKDFSMRIIKCNTNLSNC